MVTAYLEEGSSKLLFEAGCGAMAFGGKIRPSRLIFSGMLLEAEVKMLPYKYNPDPNQRYPDLASSFGLDDVDQQLGREEEGKLADLFRKFARHAISSQKLKLDAASADYVKDNLPRVIDFLVPKLKGGHLTLYEPMFGKGLKKGGAFTFLDLSMREKPVFLFPAFGLKAITYAKGFVPWRPGTKETYLPDMDPFYRKPFKSEDKDKDACTGEDVPFKSEDEDEDEEEDEDACTRV